MRLCSLFVDPPRPALLTGLRLRLHSTTVEPFDATRLSHTRPDPQAVLLAGRVDPAAELLQAGVPVLLAAEPVPEWLVLEPLLDLARSTGTRLAVVNPDRFLPSRRLIQRHLNQCLGRPGLVRMHRWDPDGGASHEVGGLPEPFLRDLDVAFWLFGRRPERVFAVRRSLGDSGGELLQVHLGFPAGGMALLDTTLGLPPGENYQGLSVIASDGAAYVDGHTNSHLAFHGGPARMLPADETAGQMAALAQEFVDALLAGNDPGAGYEVDWAGVFAVVRAVRDSLLSGQASIVEEVVP